MILGSTDKMYPGVEAIGIKLEEYDVFIPTDILVELYGYIMFGYLPTDVVYGCLDPVNAKPTTNNKIAPYITPILYNLYLLVKYLPTQLKIIANDSSTLRNMAIWCSHDGLGGLSDEEQLDFHIKHGEYAWWNHLKQYFK